MGIVARINKLRERRKNRVRTKLKLFNRSNKKRIYLHISNKYLYVQLIDDVQHKTLLTLSPLSKTIKDKEKLGKNKESAKKLAELFVEEIKSRKIESNNGYIFDRGAKLYHGKVKVFADTLREKGITV